MRPLHIAWFAGLACGVMYLHAQGSKFDVASLKASGGGRGGRIGAAPGGERYVATNTSLKTFIAEAYRIRLPEVQGGPEWVDHEFYDLNAKAGRPSNAAEFRVMLQNLLADLFKLRFHHETKTLPAYALLLDKDGAKL